MAELDGVASGARQRVEEAIEPPLEIERHVRGKLPQHRVNAVAERFEALEEPPEPVGGVLQAPDVGEVAAPLDDEAEAERNLVFTSTVENTAA
jgi:hypothetical protein